MISLYENGVIQKLAILFLVFTVTDSNLTFPVLGVMVSVGSVPVGEALLGVVLHVAGQGPGGSSLVWSIEYPSVPGALLLQQPHLLHGEGQPGVHGAEHQAVVLPQQLRAVAHHEATQLPEVES